MLGRHPTGVATYPMVLSMARSAPQLKIPTPGEQPTPIVPEPSTVPADPEPAPTPGPPGDPQPPSVPEPDPDRDVPIEPPDAPQTV